MTTQTFPERRSAPDASSDLLPVLLVGAHPTLLDLLSAGQRYDVLSVSSQVEGLRALRQRKPAVVLVAFDEEETSLHFIRTVRRHSELAGVRLIVVADSPAGADTSKFRREGADDFVPLNLVTAVLLNRIDDVAIRNRKSAKVTLDGTPELADAKEFRRRLALRIGAVSRRNGCALALIDFAEMPRLYTRYGAPALEKLKRQVSEVIGKVAGKGSIMTLDRDRHYALFFERSRNVKRSGAALNRILRALSDCTFEVGSDRLHLTPVAGFLHVDRPVLPAEAWLKTLAALDESGQQLDVFPVSFNGSIRAQQAHAAANHSAIAAFRDRIANRVMFPFQLFITFIFSILFPLSIYAGLAAAGHDISGPMYLVVVVALLITACFIWVEGFFSLRKNGRPAEPASPYPKASAIIAAYLPNEAATIIDTVEAFLRIEYEGDLEIIVAYNTPRPMPVEKRLRAIAAEHRRVRVLKVEGSTSKAQNVNAGLALVTGEFTGLFDADHHPDPDAFANAWRWLSHGADVVQGHCAVRNGEESWVSRMVAVEFEAIYAVSHPGRARLHHFGIFGGSNGYWRTALLRKTRMRGFMLTEDIDSSMRALEAGAVIVSDPEIVSRELAPTTVRALWHQRMRWAQGWFQVSRRHARVVLNCARLTPRQKFGMAHLLVWREVYPWISTQIIPILLFWLLSHRAIHWFVPLFVLTTLFTTATGPAQLFFISRLAVREVRERRSWMFFYALISFIFYAEFKNLISRIAQMKELTKERTWRVTPRRGPAAPALAEER